ncbi:MAG: hypothetical protein IPN90_02490 [Elusimicrobia bacterium]|jgi:hypothetical protein|nr:hypothetical protein [Elusimicrobiota bacterium]
MKSHAYSHREKILVTTMLTVVSLFLLQRFVLAPYRTRMDELQSITARKERQVRRIKTLLASRKEIEADYSRRFNSRTGAGPLLGEMGTFLKSIEKLAREKSVKMLDIRPRPAEDRTKPQTLSANFVMESAWPALASLLVALEAQSIEVEKITLTRSARQSPQIKAQIQLTQD